MKDLKKAKIWAMPKFKDTAAGKAKKRRDKIAAFKASINTSIKKEEA